MSDETKSPIPMDYEWHARECDAELNHATEMMMRRCASGHWDGVNMYAGNVVIWKDRAAKLRQAARDAVELEVLRDYAREADGVQCEHCDTVCIPGADDSEDWSTDHDEDETIHLCYYCSEKARAKEAPDEE